MESWSFRTFVFVSPQLLFSFIFFSEFALPLALNFSHVICLSMFSIFVSFFHFFFFSACIFSVLFFVVSVFSFSVPLSSSSPPLSSFFLFLVPCRVPLLRVSQINVIFHFFHVSFLFCFSFSFLRFFSLFHFLSIFSLLCSSSGPRANSKLPCFHFVFPSHDLPSVKGKLDGSGSGT